ncbi:hypothetical protein [Streptomyces griseorubiginosus]
MNGRIRSSMLRGADLGVTEICSGRTDGVWSSRGEELLAAGTWGYGSSG